MEVFAQAKRCVESAIPRLRLYKNIIFSRDCQRFLPRFEKIVAPTELFYLPAVKNSAEAEFFRLRFYSSTSAKHDPPINSRNSELQGTHFSSSSLKYFKNLISLFAMI